MAVGRRVLFLCTGSRGDVQPFVALALHLQSTGITVKLGTTKGLVDFARSAGVDVAATATADAKAQWSDPEVQRLMSRPGHRAAKAKMAEKYFGEQALKEVELIRTFQPDIIIVDIHYRLWRAVISHVFDVPLLYAPVNAFPLSTSQSSWLGEPDWVPGRVHVFFGLCALFAEWQNALPRLRAAVAATKLPGAGLYTTCLLQYVYDTIYPLVRPICAQSAIFEAELSDLEESQKPIYTGAWILEASLMPRGSNDFGGGENAPLERFLASGDTPVCFAWGFSGRASPQHMARLAVGALRQLDVRGVITAGYSQLSPALLEGDRDLVAYAEKQVLFVKSAAHETLFPRCSVIVHHSGVGTVAAALRAGKPQVLTPFDTDQDVCSRAVARAGAAVRRCFFERCTLDGLCQDIRTCLTDKVMVATCERLAAQTREETGVCMATELISQVFREQIDTGRWREAHERRKVLLTQPKAKRQPSCFVWLAKACCSPQPVAFRSWVE